MHRLIAVPLICSIFWPIHILADQQFLLHQKSIQISDDLIPLLDLLKNKGFNVKFKNPPGKRVLGLFQIKSKTLWVSPISFVSGIGRQTLLHEATHAAQSCPSGVLTPIGWELPISSFIKKEIQKIVLNNYDSEQYLIEIEAFSLQGQKNAVELLLEAINNRC